jgi:hypothetical protein
MESRGSRFVPRVLAGVGLSACMGLFTACGGDAAKQLQMPMQTVTPPGTGGVSAPVVNSGPAGTMANVPPPVMPSGAAGGAVPPPVMPSTGGAPAPMMGTGGMTSPPVADAGSMMMDPTLTTGSNLYDPMTKMLAAPAAGDGIQISTTLFDLQPGEEAFKCYHAELPVDGEIDVRYYESVMAPGSHHFILYKNDGDTAADGTLDDGGCLANPTGSNWVYSSAQPHMDLKIPDGVAIVLSSRQRVVFDMHYINTTEQVLHANVTLNISFAKGAFEKAASLVSYNTSIFIPPNGTQTVDGDCTPGDGAKFFYMLTHTHRRGTLATISRVLASGQMGEEIVHSANWEVPQEKKWLKDPFMTFQTGEKFHYHCEYMNDLNQYVTSGPSAATNEMCMAITYYFPASAGGSCF